ncbi:hypothetical protein ACE6H2_000636 [Prunus campanulata]
MLLKPRNSKKKNLHVPGKGTESNKWSTKEVSTKNVKVNSGSRFNVLNDEVGIEDNLEGSRPFKYAESSSRGHGQATEATSSKTKYAGKKISSTRGSSPWVFKKPFKDITNSNEAHAGGKTVKNDSILTRPWKNKIGTKSRATNSMSSVGLQAKGSQVQDDVCGMFSFNVNDSVFTENLGKGGPLHGHEPPDFNLMGLPVTDVDGVNFASDDMDLQCVPTEHGETELGREAGMSFYHDVSEAFVAEQVQN